MKRVYSLSLAIVFFATALHAAGIKNAEFKEGGDQPKNWTLSSGQGRWVDRDFLQVRGAGGDSNSWRYDGGENLFAPGRLYHFYLRTRCTDGGGGCVTAGPSFANRDLRGFSSEWRWDDFVFVVPENGDGHIRLGQYETKATHQFDAVRLVPTIPVHKSRGDIVLGQGESIRGNKYSFAGDFEILGGNFSRALHSANAVFNTNRWNLYGDGSVVYRFAVPGQAFQAGDLQFSLCHVAHGGCLAEVSTDGQNWRPLATCEKVGQAAAAIPAELLPATAIFIRFKAMSGDSSVQLDRVFFEGKLDGNPPEIEGQTYFADVEAESERLAIENISLVEGGFSGRASLKATIKNTGTQSAAVAPLLNAAIEGKADAAILPAISPQQATIAAGETAAFIIDLPTPAAGKYHLSLAFAIGGDKTAACKLAFTVPEYYRSDYGKSIIGGENAVWWCDAVHKIPPKRPAPQAAVNQPAPPAAELAAARNDFEAVQIVVRPEKGLKNLTAAASTLAGPDGAEIAAGDIQILRVYYHSVENPTDKTGVRDRWPDALPPLDKPIDVTAGENQPLWVLVRVREDAKPGDYTGTIKLQADGWQAETPIRLHVWDFALPQKNHIDTAFGLSAGTVFQYHGLKTGADRRRVMDMYLQSFADHRISPYDPAPLDPIVVHFDTDADPPSVNLDFTGFDRAMTEAVEKYHFTNIRLPIQGMGGGTFHDRYEPQIGPYGKDTPQYTALFSDYVKRLESHLREKGWLDMAYVYWFDEPDPKDYDFVRGGMKRLHDYAPGLARMLTEQPEPELIGAVDIWCPLTPTDDPKVREACFARGERMWWYVCTGPKAPYCTLFIDHPATELRVWLWQTWQRDITGILVWTSNYWTSSAAYPDSPQNPYEDPMGYVSGYSTPKGIKAFWGNGDGRFIYPPLAAAVPGKSGDSPVVEPPVSSIRWEMLREGIEDYEMLYLLRELLDAKRQKLSPAEVAEIESLLTVPHEISESLTKFATDSGPIYARRAEIAEAIERLAKIRP